MQIAIPEEPATARDNLSVGTSDCKGLTIYRIAILKELATARDDNYRG